MSQLLSNNTDCFNTTITNNIAADDDRSKILAWLSPLDPGSRHQEIRERRVEMVGEWVLQTEEFRNWYAGNGEGESNNEVLFCYGDPGVGKTFISSLVIDHLCDQAQGKNVAVACFYFDFAAQKEQSSTNMLGALLRQVVSDLEEVPEKISQAYKDQKKGLGGRRPLLSDIVRMLQATSSETRTFLCIDALDECVERYRAELLDSLDKILQESPSTRIFVTARPQIRAEIKKRLDGRVVTIPISPRRGDIIKYLRIRLGQDTIPDAMDRSLETDILKKIPKDISEIFLLVSLNVDTILQETTIHGRRQKLSIMTGGLGLGDAYSATLDRIEKQGGGKAKLGMDALMWISYSERPLKVNELCHALAVTTGSANLNPDNVPSIGTLLACCQGLVSVDKDGSIIRLIHLTLQEYLRTHPQLFRTAHSAMAQTCLTYLNSQQVMALPNSRPPDLRDTPFLEYSSLYWGVHAKKEFSGCVKLLVQKLFDHYNNHISTKLFLAAQEPYSYTIDFNTPSLFSSLHCSSAFGIVEIVAGLVEVEGCDINQKDSVGNTPLVLAAQNGHDGVVQILLGRGGIRSDEPGACGQTPLCSTAGNGHEEVVRILLKRDDINRDKPDQYGQTPLFRAAWNRHMGVVKILRQRAGVVGNIVAGSLGGNRPGNADAFNRTKKITNHYSTPAPSDIPATFGDLVARNRWAASPPEINLDYLRDPHNLPMDSTGEWIFKDDRYKKWRESEVSGVLWLRGGPGIGKTMLAKRVAAELLKGLTDPSRGVKLVFHFASPELPTGGISTDEAESPEHGLAKVACDLLYGILQQDGSLFDNCKTELENQGDKFFTNHHSLWKVLRNTIQDCPTDYVYILIDGIDGLRKGLCEGLIGRILQLKTARRVKIFLSSRDIPHVSNSLPKCTNINLDTNNFVKEDLKTFIRCRVNAFGGWDDEQKAGAIETLLAESQRSFLWVSLVVACLARSCPGHNYGILLKKLPQNLEDLYRKMLSDVLSLARNEEILNLIRTVALALRPLTFGELGYILACTEEREARTAQHRSPKGTGTKIRLKIEAETRQYVQSSLGFLRATAVHVSIIDNTAIECLFDENFLNSTGLPCKSDLDLAISWECFQYLNRALGELDSEPDHQEEPAEAEWPYLRYAAESWFLHARRSIETTENKFWDDPTRDWLRYQFFDTSDVIRKPWIELCGDPKMDILAGDQTPLNVAVCLGLTPLVEKALLDSNTRTEDMNSNQSPLHLAAKSMSGAYGILIDKGNPSVLTTPDQYGNTPLHEAAISGHRDMLVNLVNKFAALGYRNHCDQINKQNHSGNTPLHLAFQFDHPDIVEFLTRNRADRTIKNNEEVTAFELGAILGRGYSLDILKRVQVVPEAKKETAEEPAHETVEEGMKESVDGVVDDIPDEFGEDIVKVAAEEVKPLNLGHVLLYAWLGIFCYILLAVWMYR